MISVISVSGRQLTFNKYWKMAIFFEKLILSSAYIVTNPHRFVRKLVNFTKFRS